MPSASQPQRQQHPSCSSLSSSCTPLPLPPKMMMKRPTGLLVFTTLLWTVFFLTVIVLVGVVQGYPGMVKKIDQDPRPRLMRVKELANMQRDLRQGDYRLVRPTPTSETEIEQHRYCPYKLNSFLMTLCTSTVQPSSKKSNQGRMAVSLHKRGFAAEAIALCLTNQPEFRDIVANTTFLTTELNTIQQNELVAHSLAEGLYVLLSESLLHYRNTMDAGAIQAMAQAAEAVWIASFHHPHHLGEMLQYKLIDILGDIIVSLRPSEETVEFPYLPARAVMWACAALQNLAANYCDNDLGFCIWQWSNDHQLVLDEETRLEAPELAEEARRQIMAVPNLLETLAEWVCQGPIDQKPSTNYGWPGDAQLWVDLSFNQQSPHLKSPSIVPWAAAGAIKNLLLGKNNPELQERLHALPNLQQCLCQLRQSSPDWLEQGKATDAIYFWSPLGHGNCPNIYDTCQDDSTWENAESGDTCMEYTQERWCVEYGMDVNVHGKTAKDACCACGGGYPTNEKKGDTTTEQSSNAAADGNTSMTAAKGDDPQQQVGNIQQQDTTTQVGGEVASEESLRQQESARHEEL